MSGQPRILVVDDSATVRDLLSRRLGRKGYAVFSAADGKEGLEIALRTRPNLVIMDLHMPVMDGWQATKALRETTAGAAIPVIVLTAHDSPRDRSSAMAAGCSDFDSKPVSMPRLLLKIERILGPSPVP